MYLQKIKNVQTIMREIMPFKFWMFASVILLANIAIIVFCFTQFIKVKHEVDREEMSEYNHYVEY